MRRRDEKEQKYIRVTFESALGGCVVAVAGAAAEIAGAEEDAGAGAGAGSNTALVLVSVANVLHVAVCRDPITD